MNKKKSDDWWSSDKNDLDNDIEQFSRNNPHPASGGCLIALVCTLALLAVLFVA